MDTLDLSEFFNTRPQAQDFSSRLALISGQIFQMSFSPEAALLEHFGIKKKEAFMTLMRNNGVNAESRKSIKEFIDAVQLKITTLPVVSLVLAFEPKMETLQFLSRWFIINTKKQVIFEIEVKEDLIGGAAIKANGKYWDFSLKPKLDAAFADMMTPKPAAAAVEQVKPIN